MTSNPEMASCYVYKILFFLSCLHASLGARASRSLDLTPVVESGYSLRARSVLDQQDDSVGAAAAAVKPAKLVEEDRLSTNNWQAFSQKLLTRQMGSKPPDCDGKCDLCRPCEAVEVPISNRTVQKVNEDSSSPKPSALAAQPADTNYMPESWRCACGNEYYNP